MEPDDFTTISNNLNILQADMNIVRNDIVLLQTNDSASSHTISNINTNLSHISYDIEYVQGRLNDIIERLEFLESQFNGKLVARLNTQLQLVPNGFPIPESCKNLEENKGYEIIIIEKEQNA